MDPADSIVHRAVRLIDMMDGPVAHTSRLGNILCTCRVVMCLVQQLQRLAEAAVGTHARIVWLEETRASATTLDKLRAALSAGSPLARRAPQDDGD